MKNQNTPAPIVPTHDASGYAIYKPERFTSAATARKRGVVWLGQSLTCKSSLLECFDASGIEIPSLFFDKKSCRFKQY